MAVKDIVIIEDDPKDEKLMLRAFRKINLKNPLIILRDGEEALEFFQARGPYSDRNPQELPAVVMLDLKLPKVDGLQVLEALRADPNTQKLPIVILTSADGQIEKLWLGCQQLRAEANRFCGLLRGSRATGNLLDDAERTAGVAVCSRWNGAKRDRLGCQTADR